LGEDGLAGWSDAKHFSEFIKEIVPDTSDLELKEIVRIRQDDTFEQWRLDLRAAIRDMVVTNSTPGLSGEGREAMQVRLHEDAAKIEKAVVTNRSMAKLRDRTVDFMIGGIGAVSVMPIVGSDAAGAEVTMLAGSLGSGALAVGLGAVARFFFSQSESDQNARNQALAHHYAFVGKYARR
jgi:hypothetical protein